MRSDLYKLLSRSVRIYNFRSMAPSSILCVSIHVFSMTTLFILCIYLCIIYGTLFNISIYSQWHPYLFYVLYTSILYGIQYSMSPMAPFSMICIHLFSMSTFMVTWWRNLSMSIGHCRFLCYGFLFAVAAFPILCINLFSMATFPFYTSTYSLCLPSLS